jgi:hypothetical protein
MSYVSIDEDVELYDEDNTFEHLGIKYEKLHNHPRGEKYRAIFSDNDYDYIEDTDLIKTLDEVFNSN